MDDPTTADLLDEPHLSRQTSPSSRRSPSKKSAHSNSSRGSGEIARSINGEIGNGWAECLFLGDNTNVDKAGKKGMMVDADSMKEQMRQNMIKPRYDVANFYHQQGIFRYIATHKVFEAATLSVIAFNALWISIDTDHNDAAALLQATPLFQTVEHFFCCYFTFEWFVRFCAFKRKRNGCRDAWFVFDSCMVFMMVAETWVMTLIMLASGAGGSGGMGNASILRLARLLRLSRMARMARLLRAMPELLILIKGMIAATRSVFFCCLLLAILTYVFGIMFTQLLVDTEIGETAFGTVTLSMHTLILDGAMLDNLGTQVKALGDVSLVYGFLFYIYVFISFLTILNMLIGVLCEVVAAVAETEHEAISVGFVHDKLQQVMSQIEEDGDGTISYDEFVKILDKPEACLTLQEVGVDVMGLVDLADFIFAGSQDEDEEPKSLTFEEFLEIVLSMRGNNSASVKDIVDVRRFISKTYSSLEAKLEKAMDRNLERSISVLEGSWSPSTADCLSPHSQDLDKAQTARQNFLSPPSSAQPQDLNKAQTAKQSLLSPPSSAKLQTSSVAKEPAKPVLSITVSRSFSSATVETQSSTPEPQPASGSAIPLRKIMKLSEVKLDSLIDRVSNKRCSLQAAASRRKRSRAPPIANPQEEEESFEGCADMLNTIAEASAADPDEDDAGQKFENLQAQLLRLREAINSGMPAMEAAQQTLHERSLHLEGCNCDELL